MEQPEKDSHADGQNPLTHSVGLTKEAMKAIVAISLEAMKGAPFWCKAIIALSASVIFLGLIGAVGLFVRGDSTLALWLMLACIALTAFAMWILRGIATTQPNLLEVTGGLSKELTSTSRRVPWARAVPRLPIPDNKLTELWQELDAIRNTAFEWLKRRHPEIKIEEVRANVFLPDINEAANGHVCELFMPEQLRIGMEGHVDEAIRFRPRQGVTGDVFIKQQKRVAYTIKEAQEGKAGKIEVYSLTQEQKRQINRDLCWIVSFPLRIPDQRAQKTAGVLNIDGLNHELSRTELESLMGELAFGVARFTERLAALPKTRISITLEDI